MEWQAQKAAQTLAQTGQITVVVQDNGSIHTSLAAQTQWHSWQQQGLYLFMLPKYCSEIDEIETEWHQLDTHEIAGRMFNNEYDLAVAVMDGMTSRSAQGEYTLERFKFNSTWLLSQDETIRFWEVKTGKCLTKLRVPRPYEGMNITQSTSLTQATTATLKALGAVEVWMLDIDSQNS